MRLDASSEPSEALTRLIERTRFGTSGLRYRRLGVAQALARTRGGVFLSLTQDNEVIGSYVLEQHPLLAGQRAVCGVYRSQLCVAPESQGRGFGRLIVEKSLSWLDEQAGKTSVPVISYGCIESGNSRSLGLLKSARTSALGHLHTQMVYRQWPRRKVAFERLDAVGDRRVRDIQAAAYQDCGLTYAAPTDNTFFAVTRDNVVVAGAHANVVRLNFDRMGQPWDFLSDHVFAHVGPARRRFDPRNFRYLKLDGVVAAPGSERVWRNLISTLLAEHGVHMAMFTLDDASQVSRRLSEGGVFGRIARSTRQRLAVIARSHGSQHDWLENITRHPVGIGPFGQ